MYTEIQFLKLYIEITERFISTNSSSTQQHKDTAKLNINKHSLIV